MLIIITNAALKRKGGEGGGGWKSIILERAGIMLEGGRHDK